MSLLRAAPRFAARSALLRPAAVSAPPHPLSSTLPPPLLFPPGGDTAEGRAAGGGGSEAAWPFGRYFFPPLLFPLPVSTLASPFFERAGRRVRRWTGSIVGKRLITGAVGGWARGMCAFRRIWLAREGGQGGAGRLSAYPSVHLSVCLLGGVWRGCAEHGGWERMCMSFPTACVGSPPRRGAVISPGSGRREARGAGARGQMAPGAGKGKWGAVDGGPVRELTVAPRLLWRVCRSRGFLSAPSPKVTSRPP